MKKLFFIIYVLGFISCKYNCEKDADNARWAEKQRWINYHIDVIQPEIIKTLLNSNARVITKDSAITRLIQLADDITPFYK